MLCQQTQQTRWGRDRGLVTDQAESCDQCNQMQIQENIPLAPLTTFGIGGPARFFALVENVEELEESLDFARDRQLKVFVLGGGSNVLVGDKGFDGLVIKIEIKGIEEVVGLCVAGAGERWDALVEYSVQKNLWGIENLSGIPGSVGGSTVQNVGAYGQALSQTLEWIEVYDTYARRVLRLAKSDCAFGYRRSIFKESDGRYIVLRVALKLSATGTPSVSYKDLREMFLERSPPLQEVRDAVLEIRAKKFPNTRQEGTAGSFFKNPILSAAKAEALQAKYPEMPLFALPESTDIKVPLAWFLDYRHGVMDLRGVVVGGARMYEKQFLVLVAEKNTLAEDVKKLAVLVQKKVRETLGVEIEPEVKII